jgi:hypothetical protein
MSPSDNVLAQHYVFVSSDNEWRRTARLRQPALPRAAVRQSSGLTRASGSAGCTVSMLPRRKPSPCWYSVGGKVDFPGGPA